MKREISIAVVPIGDEGGLRWPGREKLSPRDRVIIESRSTDELLVAAAEVGDDPEEVLGLLENVLQDSLWLRDKLDEPRPPFEKVYRASDAPPLDCWRSLLN